MTKNTPLFTNVVTFFSVLLPGCTAVTLLLYRFDVQFESLVKDSLGSNPALLAFAFFTAAYFIGQIVNQVCSLLDKQIYDRFKGKIFKNSKRLHQVKGLRELLIGHRIPSSISTFDWAYSRLRQDQAQEASEVERKIADSKFFRSFIGLWLMSIFLFLTDFSWKWVFGSVGFLLISLTAYILLRRQGTELAYKGVLLLHESEIPEKGDTPRSGQEGNQEEQIPKVQLADPPAHYSEALARLSEGHDLQIAFVSIPVQQQRQLTLPPSKADVLLFCLQGGGYVVPTSGTENLDLVQMAPLYWSEDAIVIQASQQSITLNNTTETLLDVAIFSK